MTEIKSEQDELLEDLVELEKGIKKIIEHVKEGDIADAVKHYEGLIPYFVDLHKLLGEDDEPFAIGSLD